MNRIVLIFIVLMLIMTGCGDTNWFPETIKSPTTPTAFTFTNQFNVATNTTITSAAVTITGIQTPPSPISISGDATSKYSINGGAFTSVAGTVNNGDQVTVQHVSGSLIGQTVTTTLTVGSFSASFTSTTANLTINPTTFTPLTAQPILTTVISPNSITVTSTGLVQISVTNGSWSTINSLASCTSATLNVSSGATIFACQQTASTSGVSTVTNVNIGGLIVPFQTTTQ